MKNLGLLFISVSIFFILLVSCADTDSPNPGVYNNTYTPGIYTGEVSSYGGVLKVSSTFSETAITSVEILEHHDTATRDLVSDALRIIPQLIAIKGSTNVDTVTGASITSHRILDAVEDCTEQARITKTTVKPNSYQFINNSAYGLTVAAGGISFELKPGGKKTVTISGDLSYTYDGTGYYNVTPQESADKIIFKNG